MIFQEVILQLKMPVLQTFLNPLIHHSLKFEERLPGTDTPLVEIELLYTIR